MIPPLPPPQFHAVEPVPPPLPLELAAMEPNLGAQSEPLKGFRLGCLLKTILRWIASITEWLFGLAAMVVALAVLAAIPGLQFLSLGYLLESSARVARSGRIREAFIGIRVAARLGGAILAIWLLILPLRYLSNVAFTAEIINPDGGNAARLRISVFILTMILAGHIVFALARGGRFRHFLWPLNFIAVWRMVKAGGAFARARDATLGFLISLRLPYYFWLGFRGFVAAFIWLVIPVSFLAFGQVKAPIAPLVGFLGAFLLAVVVLHIPLLQTRMAIENNFRTGLDWRGARRAFCRAPWACSTALTLTLAFALPLYLLKIEVVPQEALWLPALVFILFIFPVRVVTGWALARTMKRETPRHWFFRWTGRLPLVPAVLIYLLFVFFSQYTSWNGIGSLYEQHAFLLPVPFFSL